MVNHTAAQAVRFGVAEQPAPSVSRLGVHEIFEGEAASFPDRIAIVAAEGSITYGDLDRAASAIASALIAKNVKPGDVVMIAVERSLQTITSFLGTLKAGAVYCSLDLQDAPARHTAMLQDAKPRAILTNRNQLQRFANCAPLLLCLEDLESLENSDRSTPSVCVTVDAPAALMFTSGSTGQPKGTVVPHRGIIRLFFGNDYVKFGPQLRTLFHSPSHFDACTFEIWGPLLHGGCCVIYPGERIPSLQTFGEAILKNKVNCLFLGPAFFNVIIDQNPQILSGVTDVLIGGEVMSVRHICKGLSLFSSTRFLNVYGPTETTTFATAYPIPPDFRADATSVPIGKPIAETSCYLLDPMGQPVVDGMIGELYIGGRGVGLGYVNQIELTSQRFVPDPYSSEPAAKMYRTGDLCRRLHDGNLDFVTRADHQRKIRGHRVEPGEVEVQLEQHPAVAQCAVITAEHAGQTILVGYYTLHTGTVCSPQDIIAHLRQRLPAYLVPRSMMNLSTMPLNPVGTIDRSALPAAIITINATSAEPNTLLEKQLTDIWRQVLEESSIGIDDGFFEMGGTSLDAMHLALLVEKTTGIYVPISMLLANTTVRGFASAIHALGKSVELNAAVTLADTGDLAPIYFIGGDVGHPLALRVLAAEALLNRPVYGLQLPGLDDFSKPLISVQEAARYLVPTVRRLSGAKPIHLLGYCYGGLVAYELAALLQKANATVGKLVLVDSWTFKSYLPKPLLRRTLLRIRHHLGHLYDYLFNRNLSETSNDSKSEQLIVQMQIANLAAFHQYVPSQYAGKLTSIRAAAEDRTDLKLSQGSGGWDDFSTGTLETIESAGNHVTMIKLPHVSKLARLVENLLRDSE